MKKREYRVVEVIGYTKFNKNESDIWVPPEIWKNIYSIPYNIGCYPKVSHVKKSKSFFESGKMKIYIEHNTNGPEIGYITNVDLTKIFSRDPTTLMSGLFRLNIYSDVFDKVLEAFSVTSFHDLYWSLAYKINWKDNPKGLIDGVVYKAIESIEFMELSCTENPRFCDCITLVESSNTKNLSSLFYTKPVKCNKQPKINNMFNVTFLYNYMKCYDEEKKSFPF
jgi:hypothetical protein